MISPNLILSAASRLLDPSACHREDDVQLVAEAWRELLGQEPTSRCEVLAAYVDRPGVGPSLPASLALRLAADLIRACAEVEAAEAGKGGA